METYQACVCLLVSRYIPSHLSVCVKGRAVILAYLIGPSKPQPEGLVRFTKFPAAIFGPFLVAILWQQLPRVQLDRRSVGCRIFRVAGRGGSLLEGLHVYPQLILRAHHNLLSLETQVAGGRDRIGLQGPASSMDDATQVVGSRSPSEIRPEHIHNLFAVHPVPRREG